MKKLNYPIKYALLGIEEQVGWQAGIHEIEREYAICGYIVSKVYVVGETIKYNGDGFYSKQFQVVFPFPSILEQNRQKPRYDLDFNCYNYFNVNFLFDSFDQAKNVATNKNKLLRHQKCLPKISNKEMTLIERIKKGQEEFDKQLNRYLEFEDFISKETIDMEVTPDEKIKSRVRRI